MQRCACCARLCSVVLSAWRCVVKRHCVGLTLVGIGWQAWRGRLRHSRTAPVTVRSGLRQCTEPARNVRPTRSQTQPRGQESRHNRAGEQRVASVQAGVTSALHALTLSHAPYARTHTVHTRTHTVQRAGCWWLVRVARSASSVQLTHTATHLHSAHSLHLTALPSLPSPAARQPATAAHEAHISTATAALIACTTHCSPAPLPCHHTPEL